MSRPAWKRRTFGPHAAPAALASILAAAVAADAVAQNAGEARAALRSGDYEEAIDLYRDVLDDHPTATAARVGRTRDRVRADGAGRDSGSLGGQGRRVQQACARGRRGS